MHTDGWHECTTPTTRPTTPGQMAALNEAYRVLRNPGRRALYDDELARRERRREPPRRATPPPRAPLVAVDDSPARYPWKLVAGMATFGAAVVLVAAALNEPREEPRPDNVLEPGSCVTIEANGDAREITCAETADELVVERLVPLDESCPPGLAAHRDRQGMGFACVTRRG